MEVALELRGRSKRPERAGSFVLGSAEASFGVERIG